MRKLKMLTACALFLLGGATSHAQTDVTSTYLTNADFSQTTALTVEKLYGYGKDGTPYGLQEIDGWSKTVTAGDNSNASYPNSGMAGGVIAYGSSTLLQGGGKAAPAADPDGNSGNCFGFFGVWGCGGYYYQEVTLAAGKYTINIPVYNQSGTNGTTSYFGWTPNSGTAYTMDTPTTTGSWTTLTKTFTLTEATTGQIRIGYKSKGSGSGANPMLFIDKVQILYTAVVVKDVLQTALTAATNANATLNSIDLASAIATAQGVYEDEDATQDEVNSAAATLNAATELAMSAAGDVTGIFLANPGFELSEASTGATAAGNTSNNAIDYQSSGWTLVKHDQWSCSAIVEYGGEGTVGGYSAPGSDNAGNSGKTLGVSAGWGGCAYQSDASTLPAGHYTIKLYGYNQGDQTNFKSLNGFIPTNGSEKLSTKTSFATGAWVEDVVTFVLNEATEGAIQIGGTSVDNGAAYNGKVFFDNITITYQSFLAGAKEAYDAALLAATTARDNSDYDNVTGEERTALLAEIAKAEPTTVDDYNSATDALNTATSAFTAAKSNYDAFVAAAAIEQAELTYAAEAKYEAIATAQAAEPTSSADAAEKTNTIISAIRAYYESHAMAEGVDGAIDYTSAVAAANADTNTGWTNGVGTNQGQGYTDSEGNVASKYLDGGWVWNAVCNIDMTRTVEIPAGKYLLTVKARGAEALTTYTLSIGGETINLPHSNGGSNGVFGNGWEDASIEFDADGTTQTLEVIALSETNQQWFSMNDFRLVCLELNTDAYAGETEYAALNTAIANAETSIENATPLGFEEGQYAPYNVAILQRILAKAEAIDQEAELTNLKADVDAITEALTAATTACTANKGDVDAIYNGMFDSDVEGDWGLTGWTRTNGWGQQRTGIEGDYATAYYNQPGSLKYGTTGDYTMPLAANTVYELTFAYRSHENNSNTGITVSVLNEDEEGLAATSFAANGSTSNWASVTKLFKTGAAGNYVLTLANGGNTWMTAVSLVKAEAEDITISETETYTPEEKYGNVTYNRWINEGWNVVVLPFNMSVTDVKSTFDASLVKDFANIEYNEESGVTLCFEDATEIVAGKPFLMKANGNGESFVINNVFLPATDLQDIKMAAENDEDVSYTFKGTYKATTDLTDVTFALIIGHSYFYHIAGRNSSSCKAFRAYFENTSTNQEAASRIAFNFGNGETTGISNATELKQKAESGKQIYDLQGRKVTDMNRRGIYIVNGRKVVK